MVNKSFSAAPSLQRINKILKSMLIIDFFGGW